MTFPTVVKIVGDNEVVAKVVKIVPMPGIKGIQGPNGLQGVQGSQGQPGIQGVTGIQGFTGVQGIQGRTGVQGTEGLQGEVGATGNQGEGGIQGFIGIQGSTGAQGTRGIQGFTGIQGNIGIQGRIGTQGFNGDVGTRGLQGFNGIQGVAGSQGTQGIEVQGTQGLQGSVGTSGTSGLEEWTRYSPIFQATGLTFTGSNSTYPTYNSYYVKTGKLVSFVIEVNCSTVTNFGTGQYKLQLPFTPAVGFNHFTGWANVDTAVNPDVADGHVILNIDHAGVTDILDLHYLKQSGGAKTAIIEGLFLQETPVTLTTSSKIYVNGTYIAASA